MTVRRRKSIDGPTGKRSGPGGRGGGMSGVAETEVPFNAPNAGDEILNVAVPLTTNRVSCAPPAGTTTVRAMKRSRP